MKKDLYADRVLERQKAVPKLYRPLIGKLSTTHGVLAQSKNAVLYPRFYEHAMKRVYRQLVWKNLARSVVLTTFKTSVATSAVSSGYDSNKKYTGNALK